MLQRVWQKIDTKYKDVVVSYIRKVIYNESTDGNDVQSNVRDLLKDKYSTPRENQYSPSQKVIFNLQQDDKEEELKE